MCIRDRQYALIQERKRKEKLMNLRYASATTQRGGGIALVVAGVAVGIPLVAIGLIMLLVKLSVAAPFIAAGALFGGALVFAGTRKIRLAGVFERYRNVIGLRESCSVKELAQRSSESVADVQKNVRKMLAKDMFKQATLDEASGLLLMTCLLYTSSRIACARGILEKLQVAIGKGGCLTRDEGKRAACKAHCDRKVNEPSHEPTFP